MKLRLTEIKYIGHLITQNGVKPDPKKIETIINLPSPKNIAHLQRFLGMVAYLSKFLPNMSSHTASLRKLEQKGEPWHWGKR